MKKAMPILSFVFALITLMGIIFKMQEFEGASILLTVGSVSLIVLAIFWFFLRKRTLYDFLSFLLIVLYLGMILFSMMHWPGANWLKELSALLLVIWAGFTLARK